MKLAIGVKTVDLGGGEYLHFWYANNAGRGCSNCTIIRSRSPARAICAKKQADVISQVKTSAWKGHVNFSQPTKTALGL